MRRTIRCRRPLLAAVLAAGLGAVGASGALAADQKEFDAAWSAAEAERTKAAAVGFEWRDVKKMLGEAKKLAEKGDFDAAVKLANKAKAHGMLGQAQAKEQESAWQAAVVK